jgi:hypothetical protein
VELGRVPEPVLFVGAGPVTYPSSDIVMSAITLGIAVSSLGHDDEGAARPVDQG